MDKKAKQLFEADPKLEAVYKVKDQAIYFRTKEKADAFHFTHVLEIETLLRADHIGAETNNEGTPDKTWKVDQIKGWLTTNTVAFEDGDTKAVLLGKVDEFLKSKETEK